MLEDLKKEQAGMSAQERARMALYVAGLLLLGALIVGLTMFGGNDATTDAPPDDATEPPVAADGEGTARAPAVRLDPAALTRAVAESGAEPYRWAAAGLAMLEDVRIRGVLPAGRERLDPKALAALDPATARGRAFVVRGRVGAVSSEAFEVPGRRRADEVLWTVTIDGPDGATCAAVTLGNESDVRQGAPVATARLRTAKRPIERGQPVLVRGVYLQQRSGTLGDTMLSQAVPVLFATAFRVTLEDSQLIPPIEDLTEADWEDVEDLYLAATQKWDDPALFQVLQWARAQGHDKLAAALASGALPWSEWNQETFETWKQEVDVDENAPRPFTEAARGRVFRVGGLIGDVLKMGWAELPPNSFGVDEVLRADILADHYLNRALRVWSPFGFDEFEGVAGSRAEHEHVRFYGVFIKNLTYQAVQKDRETGKHAFLTVPMFVVLDMEPHPEGADSPMAKAMWWIAGAMVLFGLMFYFVLIRGNRKQLAKMEAQRQRLRERRRAKARDGQPEADEREAPPTPAEEG